MTEEFSSTPLDALLTPGDPARIEQQALALFQSVAAGVPAYRDFLAEHDVDPAAVREMADFRALPLLTKANYLRRHSLTRLCRDGELSGCDMIAVSSGSTGEPTFWPRTEYQAPRLTLHPTGDPEYFPPDVKHHYTRG
jgi:phenylacetate-CoA ligase